MHAAKQHNKTCKLNWLHEHPALDNNWKHMCACSIWCQIQDTCRATAVCAAIFVPCRMMPHEMFQNQNMMPALPGSTIRNTPMWYGGARCAPPLPNIRHMRESTYFWLVQEAWSTAAAAGRCCCRCDFTPDVCPRFVYIYIDSLYTDWTVGLHL